MLDFIAARTDKLAQKRILKSAMSEGWGVTGALPVRAMASSCHYVSALGVAFGADFWAYGTVIGLLPFLSRMAVSARRRDSFAPLVWI